MQPKAVTLRTPPSLIIIHTTYHVYFASFLIVHGWKKEWKFGNEQGSYVKRVDCNQAQERLKQRYVKASHHHV